MNMTRAEMRGVIVLAAILIAIAVAIVLMRSCGQGSARSAELELLNATVVVDDENPTDSASVASDGNEDSGKKRKSKSRKSGERKERSGRLRPADRPSPHEPGQEVPEMY